MIHLDLVLLGKKIPVRKIMYFRGGMKIIMSKRRFRVHRGPEITQLGVKIIHLIEARVIGLMLISTTGREFITIL